MVHLRQGLGGRCTQTMRSCARYVRYSFPVTPLSSHRPTFVVPQLTLFSLSPATSPRRPLLLTLPHRSRHPDEHPRLQAAPLGRPPPLLRLRGLPGHPRARVDTREHPPAPGQGLHEPLLGRGHREPPRGPRAVPHYRRGTPAAPGASPPSVCGRFAKVVLTMSFPLARFLCVLVRDSCAFGCAPHLLW